MKKTVVITGTSRGYGKALAEALLIKGCNVIGASRTPFIYDYCDNSIYKKYCHILTDIGDMDSLSRFVLQIKSICTSVDTLINNAATSEGVSPIESISVNTWKTVFDVNLFSHIEITRALLPLLKKGVNPSIINVCSLSAFKPLKLLGPYCVSKAALKHYSLCLANELEADRIRVNAIGISADTQLQRTHAEEKKRLGYTDSWKKMQNNPPPSIESNVDLALFLVSDNSKYITGQYIEAHSMGTPTW